MSATKAFLSIIGIPFVLLQAYWTLAPGTGFVHTDGFLQAFPKYFELNWGNSLQMAGVTDLVMISVIAWVWMYVDTPPERRWTPKFFVWLISYIVFPGLGFLVYFLVLNPDHRFVAGRTAKP